MEAGRGRGKDVVTAAQGGGKRAFYMSVVVLLVGGIGTLSYMSTRPTGVGAIDTTLAPIPNQGHAIGSDSAPVEVVEFGDFECGVCGSFAILTEPDVRARLVQTGVIRFRFMDMPLQMHRNTWPAHSAAWCAGEQGKFWEMHDALFMNQDRWNGEATRRPEKVLRDLARQAGVGMEQYDACVDGGKYIPQIRANAGEGARRGVGGTPTFFFGTRVFPANLSYDRFKAYVDTALADARGAKGTTKAK